MRINDNNTNQDMIRCQREGGRCWEGLKAELCPGRAFTLEACVPGLGGHSGVESHILLNLTRFSRSQTEAPLLIRPYLADMTLSEVHAVMTGGFATISGTVLGAFISFGVGIIFLITPGWTHVWVLQTLIPMSGLTDWSVILDFCVCDGCPISPCLVKVGLSRSGGIQVQE